MYLYYFTQIMSIPKTFFSSIKAHNFLQFPHLLIANSNNYDDCTSLKKITPINYTTLDLGCAYDV